MKQILVALQQPIPTAELSFTADDCDQLNQAHEANVIMAPTKAEAPIAEAEAVVIDDSPTSYEVLVAEDVDAARAEARDGDPPVTSAADTGDLDNDEEDGESLELRDAGKDLDDNDDEDNDDDDFMI
ncbi:uncharacterized protein LOC112504170 [Cynara cardunculus var. scolymus]|uniref:uncharacterized protein LOC112504170 n=1 Tax=Cynara cardunculus var. scolymus TaxID=59895 RepID=UPI000D62CF50|nr:uncharacterized protein LOC112504170 [Cynara cardunculus var. scolymus]